MEFSPYFYIAIVLFILVVNIWLVARFLIKAGKWRGGTEGDDV